MYLCSETSITNKICPALYIVNSFKKTGIEWNRMYLGIIVCSCAICIHILCTCIVSSVYNTCIV